MLVEVIALLLASQGLPLVSGNLSQELYSASTWASGSKMCDRKWAARLGRRFDKRFGDRIRALIKVHEDRFGPDPDFLVTSSCIRVRAGTYSQVRAMRAFESVLRGLERKYGGY